MVVGVVELRQLLSRARARARRATGELNKIVKISNKKPSMDTVEKVGSALQSCLGHIKEITRLIDNISQ